MIGLNECQPDGIGGSNSSMGDSSTISTSSRGPGPGGGCEQLSARERALQTMEYYHNITNVRHNLGLASRKTNNGINPSTTYTSSGSIPRRHHLVQESLYRSNSSLELQDHHNNHQHHHLINENGTNAAPLRREYGSHGSIDVIASERNGVPPPGTTSEAFFAMLVDYRSAMLCAHAANDQRSPGPSEYLRTKGDTTDGSILTTASDDSVNADRSHPSNSSPKLRLKLNRLWGGNGTNGSVGSSTANNKGSRQTLQDDSILSTTSSNGVSTTSSDLEERQRRRAFAHHDCQSLTASLVYAVKLRGMLLARRRNTATGASAASMMTRASTPDAQVSGTDSGDEDNGDGQCNELIESCPFFRNEVGGEQARAVSLTRLQAPGSQSRSRPLHRPPLAYGVSVLEFASGETHWRSTACPYQRLSRPIESVDHGALYYRKYFYGQEHQNWFGIDEQLGPIAISIRRERIQPTESSSTSNSNNQYQYRLVIRTSELLTLRGAILEEAIPGLKSGGSGKTAASKEVLEHVAPEIQLPCLRLGIPNAESQLLKLDEQGLTSHYKVGIMYCKAGQASEEEMYNNEEAGPAFLEFLETIGQRVRLKGFDKYKAGLDNKTDSTGIYSVYSQYQDCEIMFHVSTYLPFTPNNRQQLLRKRHIGNDIVTIVFQEPGAQPFTPKNIRSQFQHVFLVVRAINPCSENTQYAIAVSRSKDVPVFGPPIRDGARFPKSKAFADFLLSKVINAENAAHRSEKFATMATRTRQEYLKDLATNYATTTLIDTGQKFSIFGGSKKKERTSRTGFIPDSCQRGAICWQVVLDDSGQAALVDSLLGISTDTFVLVEECSRQPVFVTPCSAILGWHAHGSSLRIYHHQGECTTIQMRETVGDRDELMEIVARLRAVTQACPVQELSLRRNPMGQLGFHVQPDGVVTQVESMGLAWQAGLRQGARLVEICKVAVSTLSHDQMVDLLKTSVLVTVTVVPALTDGSPRRGCTLQHCKFNAGNYESDYENVGDERRVAKAAQLQQAGNHRRRYDRSFSPPRSSNSSGYGTGSSSKSFYSKFPVNSEGTLTSSSSGRSSDDRWYEFLSLAEEKSLLIPEISENAIPRGATPPPLPARIHASSNSAFQSVTPKRSCENISQLTHCASQLQLSPSHQHSVSNHHTKVHSTHSLPLSNSNQSLSLAPRYLDFEAQDFKLNDKNCLKSPVNDSRPLPRTANIEYLVTRTPKTEYAAIHHLSSDSSAESVPTANDGHSTDTSSLSDRLLGIASEEDLSTDNSGNVSPKMRRSNKQQRNGNLTPTNGNSRNQSPRPSNGENTTRLRPGATRNPNNRNSANLSSTLQEDLMKLINPDYLSEDGLKEHEKNYYSNENGSKNERSSSKHSSKENIQKSLQNNGNNQTEVIFTMARPATVISNTSTASSPAPSEAKLSKEERLSPRVTNNAILKKSFLADSLILNESNDMDWTNLMDSATRGLLQNRADEQGSEHINGDSQEMRNGHWIDDRSEGSDRLVDSSLISTVSVPELQNHVCELESRVNRETRRRLSLEDEVRRLREENRRLQDESQAAAHQLRRFTEWFFQTIERQ